MSRSSSDGISGSRTLKSCFSLVSSERLGSISSFVHESLKLWRTLDWVSRTGMRTSGARRSVSLLSDSYHRSIPSAR